MTLIRICDLSSNNSKSQIHLQLLKLHVITNTKNGKFIYKNMLSDGLERISCIEYGSSKFSKF